MNTNSKMIGNTNQRKLGKVIYPDTPSKEINQELIEAKLRPDTVLLNLYLAARECIDNPSPATIAVLKMSVAGFEHAKEKQ